VSRTLVNAAQQALGRNPGSGLSAIRRLRQELERAEEAQVANALAAGWSWARIGRALGVSRQAVHRKYAGCQPSPMAASIPSVAASVKVALVLARTEASARGDALVGTEHLLMALLQQGEGRAASALRAAGASLRMLRAAADVHAPTDVCWVPPSRIGMTARAAASLDRAALLAQQEGEQRMCDHHILRAVLDNPMSGAVVLLRATGVSPSAVLRQLSAETDVS
jgi:Clp amino terminal domain, pathogenicity island component